MKWSSAVSIANQLEPAVRQVTEQVLDELQGQPPDLAFVFVSPHHQDRYGDVPALLGGCLGAKVLLGCSAGGVIGGCHEVEEQPALSLTAALLPDVRLQPFHIPDELLPALANGAQSWQTMTGVLAEPTPDFVLLPEPFSCRVEDFLQSLDQAFPASRKVGGLASGAGEAGKNALFLGPEIHRSGLVGLALSGNITMETVVAQGCRPIGDPLFVTSAQRNLLRAVDGQPPLHALNALYQSLAARDRELLRHSLFLGIAMRNASLEYKQGDFLIRNIIGMDPESGAIAVSGLLQENSVVQFHLRDAKTSAEDLNALLQRFEYLPPSARPLGALLFSCLGRGRGLYGRPDHDTQAFLLQVGNVPLGGFFCNGEIGPVQNTTFLHGYTSAFGLFKPRDIR
ncbi:MAG: FIST C-terminal domain-containing protein [Gammaproteobacteria bacterium]|nr:FIST C-terminal domain-containing protein [Gammaproteobacteria bacterium]MCP5424318.1 FIST C-terminal domain-containing protein [Gammaproteobacteria bacterium]MCP5459071.1 FIST C-terminal domain-containing protein [Gammaproteobacteria bacterium]